MKLTFAVLIILAFQPGFSKDAPKGVLPELKINSTNEDENQKKAVQSEIMISKAEQQAIVALQKILQKKKGTSEEPDLWYRLAELYMRRAKSGRFFDLYRDSDKAAQFAPPQIREQSAINHLKQAIQIYNKIEKEWPKYSDMDSVLFNNAFANQQIHQRKIAEDLYLRLVNKYPQSQLIPDARLSLGEMNYDAQKFNVALEHFEAIAKYPNSRVFSYGLYKTAWTLYNLHRNQEAIDKLIEVALYFSPENKTKRANHNLRSEALRDLTLFFGETHSADEAYRFFKKVCTEDELGEAMINLGKLYDSHSRQKEMNIFLSEYIDKHPNGVQRAKTELLLIQANETLKNRKVVVDHLVALAKVCEPQSEYRKEHPKVAEEQCDYEFNRVNVDLAKKWWDLWQKNKSNKEMADLTLKAFEVHLGREDQTKPDIKSRYAYAELLYQQEAYRKASEQYERVANTAQDTTIQHDASYASLVSLQKASEIKKESSDSDNLLRLSMKYIEKHPTGPHAYPVKYKIGFINYEKNNHTEADKWLRALSSDKKSGEFKRKSEDLVLDMLNAKKDYNQIKSYALRLLNEKPEKDRTQALTKIIEESDYAAIQDYLKKGNKQEAATKLYSYHQEHQDSPLAQDALWQALSIQYSLNQWIEAADTSLVYAQKYPQDKKSLDALKDAARAYSQNGLSMKAALTFEALSSKVSEKEQATFIEAAADLYLLENRDQDARAAYKKLLTDKNSSQNAKIYGQILATLKGQESSPEYIQTEKKILDHGYEPYTSEILLKRAQKLFADQKMSDAFQLAKQIVGGGGSSDTKASARLIQAQVLESELISQSTKSSLERLPTVLALKTEKLDKAQTAYLDVAKMAKSPSIQLAALDGLNRCYKNYVSTVSNPVIKADLTDEDKKALETELAKLTTPIAEKNKDLEKKIAETKSQLKEMQTQATVFQSLTVEDTLKAGSPAISSQALFPFLLVSLDINKENKIRRYTQNSKANVEWSEKARTIEETNNLLNQALANKNYSVAEKYSVELIKKTYTTGWGLYYLSIVALSRNQDAKAQWLIDLALKKEDKPSPFFYQKGLVEYKLKNKEVASEYFLKAYDEKLPSTEVTILHAAHSYSKGDCFSVVEDLSQIDSESIYQFNLVPQLAECTAQKGNADRSLAILEKAIEKQKNNVDLYFEKAHIEEFYKFDKNAAAVTYQKASQYETRPDAQEWLKNKILYLKNNTKVSVLEPLHVSSKDENTNGRSQQ
ncbi:MAG: hypothetical protein BroJett040_23350 [Oligoflexia bacterium]|nr:MAG: hypothetical protein BroJett040_23350 [Oligoflexia bacterium]